MLHSFCSYHTSELSILKFSMLSGPLHYYVVIFAEFKQLCHVGKGSFLSLFMCEKTSVTGDTSGWGWEAKHVSGTLKIVNIQIMFLPQDACQIGFVGKKDCRFICNSRS